MSALPVEARGRNGQRCGRFSGSAHDGRHVPRRACVRTSRALQPWRTWSPLSWSVPPLWLSSLSDDDGGHDFRAAASSVVELRNQSSSSVASTHHEHCRQAISELRFARLRVNMLLARSFQCMVLTNVALSSTLQCTVTCQLSMGDGLRNTVHSLAFLTEEGRFLRPLSCELYT